MENSTRYGLVAVFAVSGSMVFLAHQLHKRLLSDFMKKFELEIRAKKKVRFAKEVIEVPAVEMRNKKKKKMKSYYNEVDEYWMGIREVVNVQKWRSAPKLEDIMPPNRAVLYRGIIKHRALNHNLRF
ncbi:putative transmembrane protein [Senna tora]|uniref:Putative transmembrane protein n=1 Tax=Senna tora TaxID=362788 RepID=A0A834WJ03_9FABA|nr:putative transmembrane protein [Senna tora]